jgi:hypothetical protein
VQGTASSIAVGPTANCPQCGNQTVGANGQLQLLLITSGLVGAFFYLAFFAYGAWRYRRDATPYGLAGVLVLLMSFIFMVAYDAVGEPLCFTMLAYALLWRNNARLQNPDPEPDALTSESTPTRNRQHAITPRPPEKTLRRAAQLIGDHGNPPARHDKQQT